MPENIIPWYLRILLAPIMLVSAIGDKIQEYKYNRPDEKVKTK